MAKATKHEQTPAPPPYTVTLELSGYEAESLLFLLTTASGACATEISRAMSAAGVRLDSPRLSYWFSRG